MKKIFTFLLALIAGVGTVFAESGTSGSLNWDLTDGVLTISGKGNMENYSVFNTSPWYYQRASIKTVVIESGVKSIGDYAFTNCTALTSIQIPNTVTSIGMYACEKCSALPAITIPNSVTSIGLYAFTECTGLTSITIPGSVTEIKNAFKGCTALTAINVDPDNENYCSEDGILFNKEKTTLIQYPTADNTRTEYTIPDGVTAFGEAFCGCLLTKITIPSSVKSIAGGAFYGNSALTSVSIAEGPTSIGDYAFYECTGLTSITIPNSVTKLGNEAFRGCTALTSAVVGDGVTDMAGCFCECTALTDITIGKSVTQFGAAFDKCTNITSVTWNAKNCAQYNWGVNNKIESFTFGEEVETIPYQCCAYTKISSVVIPNSVTSIESSAFWNCHELTTVTLGNGLTSIGKGAFSVCEKIAAIDIPKSVTSIGDGAFSNCKSLPSVVIPDGITSIEDNTFFHCESLTSVTIPNSVTSIGRQAFEACYELSSITIPAVVTSIGKRAFYNCIAITSIAIPDGVTSIESETFAGCGSLVSITIGKNIASIGDKAFAACQSIAAFDVAAENQAYCTVDGVLFNKEKKTLVQYPAGKKGAYSIPESVTDFGQAFYHCYGLTSLTIPNSITSIGEDAFVYCSAMTSISIPISVTSIGDGAFAASGLETITIPDGVTSLEENVFYYCEGLKSATIGNGLTTIPNSTFWGCSALETVTIGKNVKTFGQNVFKECSNLKSIVWNAKNGESYAFGSQVESFTFGEEVETIPYKCCYEMSGLKSVTIPNSVTTIEGSAFHFCFGLKEVNIGKNVKNIGTYAFYFCQNIQSITCEATTPPTCSDEVFSGLKCEEVDLYVPISSIPVYSRTEPWSSFRISSPSGACGDGVTWELDEEGTLTISGEGAMSNWINPAYFASPLKRRQLAEEKTAPWYPYRAFIKNVVIKAGVTSIGSYAFYGCNNLESITCEATTPPTCGEQAFGGVDTSIPLNVPAGSEDAYDDADTWKDFDVKASAPTAIEEVSYQSSAVSCQKVIRDGQIFIERNGQLFDMNGHMVK